MRNQPFFCPLPMSLLCYGVTRGPRAPWAFPSLVPWGTVNRVWKWVKGQGQHPGLCPRLSGLVVLSAVAEPGSSRFLHLSPLASSSASQRIGRTLSRDLQQTPDQPAGRMIQGRGPGSQGGEWGRGRSTVRTAFYVNGAP